MGEKMFYKWMVVICREHCEYTYCHFIVHLKMVTMTNFVLGVFYHSKKGFWKKCSFALLRANMGGE